VTLQGGMRFGAEFAQSGQVEAAFMLRERGGSVGSQLSDAFENEFTREGCERGGGFGGEGLEAIQHERAGALGFAVARAFGE